MQEKAFAKINLALHVRERAPDGYHRIETVFAFAEDGDRLEVEPSGALTLASAGPFGAALPTGTDNLVLRAAEALRERFGVREGAALHLDKVLPPASGIGGGSADAAAALRLLDRFWRLDAGEEALMAIAAPLGADVPACLVSRSRRGTGKGERLEPIEDGPIRSMPLLLVNPGVPLSTAEVFAGWDRRDRGPLESKDAAEALVRGRNDLEPSARRIVPAIGEVMERLAACAGAVAVRMSGSGATCFALFRNAEERDSARAAIASEQPAWWQLATRIRS